MNQKCRRAQKESPSLIGGGEAIRPGIGQSEGSSFQGLSPPWLVDGSIKMFILLHEVKSSTRCHFVISAFAAWLNTTVVHR